MQLTLYALCLKHFGTSYVSAQSNIAQVCKLANGVAIQGFQLGKSVPYQAKTRSKHLSHQPSQRSCCTGRGMAYSGCHYEVYGKVSSKRCVQHLTVLVLVNYI